MINPMPEPQSTETQLALIRQMLGNHETIISRLSEAMPNMTAIKLTLDEMRTTLKSLVDDKEARVSKCIEHEQTIINLKDRCDVLETRCTALSNRMWGMIIGFLSVLIGAFVWLLETIHSLSKLH